MDHLHLYQGSVTSEDAKISGKQVRAGGLPPKKKNNVQATEQCSTVHHIVIVCPTVPQDIVAHSLGTSANAC